MTSRQWQLHYGRWLYLVFPFSDGAKEDQFQVGPIAELRELGATRLHSGSSKSAGRNGHGWKKIRLWRLHRAACALNVGVAPISQRISWPPQASGLLQSDRRLLRIRNDASQSPTPPR
jgi:hypothetical protein